LSITIGRRNNGVKLPKDKFNVDSAGTGSWHIGHSPDARSISTAKKKIVDISKQKEDNSIVMILKL
jgi:protein-tyrosine-phosphatase